MIGLSFVPLPTWPTPTKIRQAGSFKVDYSQIVTDLEWELRHLGATQVTLSTGHDRADIRSDGWPYFSARKPAHPGVVLQVLSRLGPLTFACDVYDFWQNNLLALSRTLKQLRTLNAGGATTAEGEPYRAYQSVGFGAPADSTAWDSTAPWSASGVGKATPGNYDRRRRALLVLMRESRRSLTNPEFQAALQSEDACRDIYRQAVLRAHPDTGGTAERFRAVMAAMESLRDSEEP